MREHTIKNYTIKIKCEDAITNPRYLITIENNSTGELVYKSYVKNGFSKEWNYVMNKTKTMALYDEVAPILSKMIDDNSIIMKSSNRNDMYIHYSKEKGFCWENNVTIARSIENVIELLASNQWSVNCEWVEERKNSNQITYVEKAAELLQKQMDITDKEEALNIIEAMQHIYDPSVFGILNAPKNAKWHDVVNENELDEMEIE